MPHGMKTQSIAGSATAYTVGTNGTSISYSIPTSSMYIVSR